MLKKILLTLLTSCLLFTTNIVNIKAEEPTITKDYLINTLGMDDEQIISSGLAYVYSVGDTIKLPMTTATEIDAGRTADNFKIPANTKWEIEFEVVSKETDSFDNLQLVTKNALPIGLTSIDDGTNSNGIHYSDMWVSKFLNNKVINMFDEGVLNYISNLDKYVIEFNVTESVTNDIATLHSDAYKTTREKMRLWIPSAKELGFGSTYTINQGTLSNEELSTIGKVYTNFKTTAKANEVKYDKTNSAGYLLREDFHTGSNTYFLCTSSAGLTHTDLTTANKSLVFGMNITWSKDIKNNISIADGDETDSSSVALTAHISSTYAVDLPETVSLTNDFTKFDYTVSGDLEEGMNVKVDFPSSAKLTYSGTFTKSDIDLAIFNSKVTYTARECLNSGTTGHVVIKNEIPSAGDWTGSIPVTISLCE